MIRGFARSILSAMSPNRSVRVRSRPAAAGISAVSRAIALAPGDSAGATFELIDRGAQIAAVPLEQLRGLDAGQPKAKQDGCLQVAIDPAHLYHHRGRKEVEHDLLRGACVHPR